MHRHFRPTRVVLILAVSVFLLVAPAGASTAGVGGSVDRGGAVANYSTSRTVTVGGSAIRMTVLTGPGLTMKARRCVGGWDGSWKNLSNNVQGTLATRGMANGTAFCLSAYRTHSTWFPGSDDWTGNLSWNS